jgi:hypothetical protein
MELISNESHPDVPRTTFFQPIAYRRCVKSWRPINFLCPEYNVNTKFVVLEIFAFCIDASFQTVFPFLEDLNSFSNTNVSEYLFEFCSKCRWCIKEHPFELHLEVSEKPKIGWCDIRTRRRMG